MKNYTIEDLQSIAENLPRIYVDADGSDVHTQEMDWINGDLKIYAEIVSVKRTEAESIKDEDGCMVIYPPTYIRTITNCSICLDEEELFDNLQIQKLIIPILKAKMYG